MRLRIVELNGGFKVEQYESYTACLSSGPSGHWNHLKIFSTQKEAEDYAEELVNLAKRQPKVVKEYDSNVGIHYPNITAGTSK